MSEHFTNSQYCKLLRPNTQQKLKPVKVTPEFELN